MTTPVTIPANPQRDTLILNSAVTNGDPVWIGGVFNEGIPLFPGQQLFLPTNQALTLIGAVADQVYVAELMLVTEEAN